MFVSNGSAGPHKKGALARQKILCVGIPGEDERLKGMNKFGFVLLIGLALFGKSQESLAFDQGHRAWGEILKTYTEDGFVDYSALKGSREGLESYLKVIENVSNDEYSRWSKEEKMAFWINAYNTFTIQTIVDHYPKKSIKQIPNVWGEKRFETLGKKWSLNQIEHEILRKEFSEPRIHFALVCASLGCPALRDEPYTASDLNSQLDSQVRDFLSDKSKSRYSEKTNTFWLSPIFKWYREDFEKVGGVIAFISASGKHYLPPEMEGKVNLKTKIAWLGYDWSLNESFIT